MNDFILLWGEDFFNECYHEAMAVFGYHPSAMAIFAVAIKKLKDREKQNAGADCVSKAAD